MDGSRRTWADSGPKWLTLVDSVPNLGIAPMSRIRPNSADFDRDQVSSNFEPSRPVPGEQKRLDLSPLVQKLIMF